MKPFLVTPLLVLLFTFSYVNAEETEISLDDLLSSSDIRITTDIFSLLSNEVFRDQPEQKTKFLKRIANDQKKRTAWAFDLLSRQSANPEEAKKVAISKSISFPNSLNEFEKKRHTAKVIEWVNAIPVSQPSKKIRIFSRLPSLGKYDFESESYYPYFFPSAMRFVQDPYERKDAGIEDWPMVQGPAFQSSFVITRKNQALQDSAVFANNKGRPRFQLPVKPEEAEKLKNIKSALFFLFEGSMDSYFVIGKVDPAWGIPPYKFSYELENVSLWTWDEEKMSLTRVYVANADTFLREHALKPIDKRWRKVLFPTE